MMVLFDVMRDQQQTDTADNNDTKNPVSTHYRDLQIDCNNYEILSIIKYLDIGICSQE